MLIIICLVAAVYLFVTDRIDIKTLVVLNTATIIMHLYYGGHGRVEGFGSETSSEEMTDYEALQNFASMVSDGTVKISNLEVTGDVSVGGDVDVTGNMTAGGDAEVTGDSTVGGGLSVSGEVSSVGKVKGQYFEIGSQVSSRPEVDGAFYRYNGQVYIGSDDKVYIYDYSTDKYVLINEDKITADKVVADTSVTINGKTAIKYDDTLKLRAYAESKWLSAWANTRDDNDEWAKFYIRTSGASS